MYHPTIEQPKNQKMSAERVEASQFIWGERLCRENGEWRHERINKIDVYIMSVCVSRGNKIFVCLSVSNPTRTSPATDAMFMSPPATAKRPPLNRRPPLQHPPLLQRSTLHFLMRRLRPLLLHQPHRSPQSAMVH